MILLLEKKKSSQFKGNNITKAYREGILCWTYQGLLGMLNQQKQQREHGVSKTENQQS